MAGGHMELQSKIFVAGANGLVGSAVIRKLSSNGYSNLLLPTRAEVDLTSQISINDFFSSERPEYVFLVAGKVGGINANNSYPAEFIRDNLLIQTLVIDAAYHYGARKLLDLGSSCIYPKHAPQPMTEECLLTSSLEATNECYALAKISGLKMCQAYKRQYGFNAISLMPTNLYGPGDNFDLKNSHVLPAMIRKFHDAKVNNSSEVLLWGSGNPKREFLFVDDLADACLFAMNNYDSEKILNVGTGTDVSIQELAESISSIIGFNGKILWDSTMPDGSPRKLLDVTRINSLGWIATTPLEEGIYNTYDWYLQNLDKARGLSGYN